MSKSLKPSEAQDEPTKASSVSLANWGGENIDMPTFEQILEMDEEDDRDFSRSIVTGFFDQAKTTFINMDKALESKDLPSLSSLGHFLKGSSAALGLTKVKSSCEKIQHFGQKKDHEGVADEDDEDICLQRIEETIKILKKDYREAERVLKSFLGITMLSSASVTDTAATPDATDADTAKATVETTVTREPSLSRTNSSSETIRPVITPNVVDIEKAAAASPSVVDAEKREASTPATPMDPNAKGSDTAAPIMSTETGKD